MKRLPWLIHCLGGAERLGCAVNLRVEHLQRSKSRTDGSPDPLSFFELSDMWKPAGQEHWRSLHDGMDLVALWFMQSTNFCEPHPLTNMSICCQLLERLHQWNHIHLACWARACRLVPAAFLFTTGGVERGHALREKTGGFMSSCGPHRHVPTTITHARREREREREGGREREGEGERGREREKERERGRGRERERERESSVNAQGGAH